MLNEKIFFNRQIPVEVSTVTMDRHPMHYHEDIELLFVLEGQVSVEHSGTNQVLQRGDVCIINRFEFHSLKSEDDSNIVMALHLDCEYFERYYPEVGTGFFAIEGGDDKSVRVVRTLMIDIMGEFLRKGNEYEGIIIELMHNLLKYITDDFIIADGYEIYSDRKCRFNTTTGIRLRKIMEHIYDNYSRKLILREIAELEDLSLFYISHMIKDATGYNFQDILNYVRVEKSVDMLLSTEKRVGTIAEENGFSAARYYAGHFEKWCGMLPSEYRKKFIGEKVTSASSAICTRCTPVKIEEALRTHREDGNKTETTEKSDAISVVVDIDISDPFLKPVESISRMESVMERNVNIIIAEPYFRFRELKEDVISRGSNYLVSGRRESGQIKGISIIICGMDQAMETSLRTIESGEELLSLVDDYRSRMEFILRFQGVYGNYRVVRSRIDRQCITKRINDYISMKGAAGIRERLINEMSATPAVFSGNHESSGNLTIRASFDGLGTELILIDKI